MTNPILLWIADFTGIYIGFVIMIATVLAGGLYMLFFVGLLDLLVDLRQGYTKTKGLHAVLPGIALFLVSTVVLVLDIVHTLILVWFGYDIVSSFAKSWAEGGKS